MADPTDNAASASDAAPQPEAPPETAAVAGVEGEAPAAPAAASPVPDPAATEPANQPPPGREMTGVVTSSKPDKTIVVRVERRVKHPVYGKFVRTSTKLAAHDEANACNEGDTVTIRQTRPISKTKSWTLGRIVERAGA